MQPITLSFPGATSLYLDAPASYPAEFEMESGIIRQSTAGNQPRLYDMGLTMQTFIMEWTKERQLSFNTAFGGYNFATGQQTSGMQCLFNFWKNVTVRGLLSFTYTDFDGVALPALFSPGKFHLKKISGQGYIGMMGIDYVSLLDLSDSGGIFNMITKTDSTVPALDTQGNYLFYWKPLSGANSGQLWIYSNNADKATVTPVVQVI